MSHKMVELAILYEHERLVSHAKQLLMTLAHYADSEGKNCYPSRELLVRLTLLSDRTIRNDISLLCSIGVIKILEKSRGRGNRLKFELVFPKQMLIAYEVKVAQQRMKQDTKKSLSKQKAKVTQMEPIDTFWTEV